MYFLAIYQANTSYGRKFNFYKVKKNMTKIIKIIFIEIISLYCEKDNFLIWVVYVAVHGWQLKLNTVLFMGKKGRRRKQF